MSIDYSARGIILYDKGYGKDAAAVALEAVNLARDLRCDVVLVDTLLLQVINQCQKMILADRASIFLVDTKTNQLYARLFNISYDREEDSGVSDFNEEVIRFYVGEGVAGHVAQTGRSVNLTDAYRSEHFNPGIDQEV